MKGKIQRTEIDDTDIGDVTSPEELFRASQKTHASTPLLTYVQHIRVSSSFFKGVLVGVALMSVLFALAAMLIFWSLT